MGSCPRFPTKGRPWCEFLSRDCFPANEIIRLRSEGAFSCSLSEFSPLILPGANLLTLAHRFALLYAQGLALFYVFTRIFFSHPFDATLVFLVDLVVAHSSAFFLSNRLSDIFFSACPTSIPFGLGPLETHSHTHSLSLPNPFARPKSLRIPHPRITPADPDASPSSHYPPCVCFFIMKYTRPFHARAIF